MDACATAFVLTAPIVISPPNRETVRTVDVAHAFARVAAAALARDHTAPVVTAPLP